MIFCLLWVYKHNNEVLLMAILFKEFCYIISLESLHTRKFMDIDYLITFPLILVFSPLFLAPVVPVPYP